MVDPQGDMNTALASAWHPRGELDRFLGLLPQLQGAFSGIHITLPPETGEEIYQRLQDLPKVSATLTPDWSWGRFIALEGALTYPCSHIQYADFDRLLRWVETRPAEWLTILDRIIDEDCLIIGRSARAYQTHPKALIQTEAISNRVVSQILGQEVDVSAGAKGFSREAAEFIMANCVPGHALGTDAEWPIVLQRAGFRVAYVAADGLDWESADRYREKAAGEFDQQAAADEYDSHPDNWAQRLEVAQEIISKGYEAAVRQLVTQGPEDRRRPLGTRQTIAIKDEHFDFESVFDVEDYLYFYEDMLTSERTREEVDFLVRELALDEKCSILDLACGFGRHSNQLAALGHHVTGVDRSQGFLEIARKSADILGVSVTYIQEDMRQIEFEDKFERVLLLFTSFGYFSDEENLLVLQNISRALKPGGLLLFDSHNRDSVLKYLNPFWVTEKNQDLMIDRQSFDTESGRMYNQRIVYRNGVRKDKPFTVRYYNPHEIKILLQQAGMQAERMFGGFDSQPLTDKSRRMLVIARKPA